MTRTSSVRTMILLGLGLLATTVMVFPVYWLISTSLKPLSEIFQYPPTWWPQHLDVTPYTHDIPRTLNLPQYLGNSLQLGMGTMLLSVALGAPFAYALARLPMRGKTVAVFSMLVLQMFPAIMLALPLFVMFVHVHLVNSLGAVILAATSRTLPFAVLVLRPFFLSLPRELEDAAAMDGASRWTTFVRIILPLSLPGLATVGAFTFLAGWGEFVFSLTLLTSEAQRPIAFVVYRYVTQYGTNWNDLMAASVIAAIPALMVFFFAQRYLVSGLTLGAKNE